MRRYRWGLCETNRSGGSRIHNTFILSEVPQCQLGYGASTKSANLVYTNAERFIMSNKEQILSLREQNKSYKEIVETVGCPISMVSYYCSKVKGNQEQIQQLRQRAVEQRTARPKKEKIKRYTTKPKPDKSLLAKVIAESISYRQVAEKMGLPQTTLCRYAKQYGIDVAHFTYGKINRSHGYKWNDEQFIEAVRNSTSIAQVILALGLQTGSRHNIGGGNYRTVQKHILRLNLDTSHFTGQSWNRENFLPIDDLKTPTSCRKFMIRKHGHQCQDCQNTRWKDQPIPLELHHINGNHSDNREENLRLLCPNCHSLTPNFRNHKR